MSAAVTAEVWDHCPDVGGVSVLVLLEKRGLVVLVTGSAPEGHWRFRITSKTEWRGAVMLGRGHV